MFWILNKNFSQDWGGELSSVLCVTADHPEYARYNDAFVYENGREAKGGYVVLEYEAIDYRTGQRNGDSGHLIIGFDNPATEAYDAILDQIALQHGTSVIYIRNNEYVGI